MAEGPEGRGGARACSAPLRDPLLLLVGRALARDGGGAERNARARDDERVALARRARHGHGRAAHLEAVRQRAGRVDGRVVAHLLDVVERCGDGGGGGVGERARTRWRRRAQPPALSGTWPGAVDVPLPVSGVPDAPCTELPYACGRLAVGGGVTIRSRLLTRWTARPGAPGGSLLAREGAAAGGAGLGARLRAGQEGGGVARALAQQRRLQTTSRTMSLKRCHRFHFSPHCLLSSTSATFSWSSNIHRKFSR